MEQLDVEATLHNTVSSKNPRKRCNEGVYVGKEDNRCNSTIDIQPLL